MTKRQRGITLIELMVAMAILAILASIALPSYQSQIRQSRRAAAQAFLMEVATRQQQRFLDVRSYAATYAALNMTAPQDVAAHYAITIAPAAGPPAGFTATATPTGAQSADQCGALSLTHTGAKAPANCW